MRHWPFPLLFAVAGSAPAAHAAFLDCVFDGSFDDAGTSAAASLDGLEVHNCARRTVVPAANPAIPAMAWSDTIATAALTYASQCHYAHSGNPLYGENIYAYATTGSHVPTLGEATLAWADEEPYYNYSSNTCSAPNPPGTCGHYTQVVWRTSTQVGCGLVYCTQNSPFGSPFNNWYFAVCNYDPPGNSGGKPY